MRFCKRSIQLASQLMDKAPGIFDSEKIYITKLK